MEKSVGRIEVNSMPKKKMIFTEHKAQQQITTQHEPSYSPLSREKLELGGGILEAMESDPSFMMESISVGTKLSNGDSVSNRTSQSQKRHKFNTIEGSSMDKAIQYAVKMERQKTKELITYMRTELVNARSNENALKIQVEEMESQMMAMQAQVQYSMEQASLGAQLITQEQQQREKQMHAEMKAMEGYFMNREVEIRRELETSFKREKGVMTSKMKERNNIESRMMEENERLRTENKRLELLLKTVMTKGRRGHNNNNNNKNNNNKLSKSPKINKNSSIEKMSDKFGHFSSPESSSLDALRDDNDDPGTFTDSTETETTATDQETSDEESSVDISTGSGMEHSPHKENNVQKKHSLERKLLDKISIITKLIDEKMQLFTELEGSVPPTKGHAAELREEVVNTLDTQEPVHKKENESVLEETTETETKTLTEKAENKKKVETTEATTNPNVATKEESSLYHSLASSVAKCKSLETKVFALENELLATRSNLDSREKKFDHDKIELRAVIDGMVSSNCHLQEKLHSLQHRVKSLTSERDELGETMEEMRQDSCDLQKVIGNLHESFRVEKKSKTRATKKHEGDEKCPPSPVSSSSSSPEDATVLSSTDSSSLYTSSFDSEKEDDEGKDFL